MGRRMKKTRGPETMEERKEEKGGRRQKTSGRGKGKKERKREREREREKRRGERRGEGASRGKGEWKRRPRLKAGKEEARFCGCQLAKPWFFAFAPFQVQARMHLTRPHMHIGTRMEDAIVIKTNLEIIYYQPIFWAFAKPIEGRHRLESQTKL
jgi:hypothetical protein